MSAVVVVTPQRLLVWALAAAAFVMVGLAAVATWWAQGQGIPEVEVTVTPLGAAPEGARPEIPPVDSSGIPPEPAKVRGPDGQVVAMPDGAELRKEGLPPRPPVAPPADEGVWAGRRDEAEATWISGMITETDRFAQARSLSGAQREALEGAMERYVAGRRDNRAAVATGRLTPAEGRAAGGILEDELDAAVTATLGLEGEALKRHLEATVHGGGW